MDLHRTPRALHGRLCSLTGLVALACLGLAVPWASAMEGPPANATVSFGAWHTDPRWIGSPINPRASGTNTS
jgi:hypothetical protein